MLNIMISQICLWEYRTASNYNKRSQFRSSNNHVAAFFIFSVRVNYRLGVLYLNRSTHLGQTQKENPILSA
jgi:hypothetical protein